MSLVLKTTVFPLRVSMRKKENWEVLIEIENRGSDKKISIKVEVPEQVSFGTVGSNTFYEKRIDSFGTLEKIELKMPVYLSNFASEGNYYGKVKVSEHFNDYAYVEKSYRKDIPFRIVT